MSAIFWIGSRFKDVIAKYGVGQNLHQGDNEDQNMPAQWAEVFAPDAVIDASDVGLSAEIGLAELVDFMRGKDRKRDQGLCRLFGLWQHREGYATVTVDGDTATAISPFFRTHETRDGNANVLHTGLWHDRLERRAEAWRIAVAWKTASSTPSRASPTRTTWSRTTPQTDNRTSAEARNTPNSRKNTKESA
jgi:hypothetical protein